MKRLGIAVLGAGRIGSLHARNLRGAVEGARVIGVMDVVEEAAHRLAESCQAMATTDDEALIQHEEVEAVLIASPTNLHTRHIQLAAKAGKAIFCEKPVALSLVETLGALEVVQEANVPFQIGFNRRYDPGFTAIAKAVSEGELGQVEMFRSQSTDPSPPPLSYVATSGGIYLDSAIHDIDMARFIAGEVEAVTALGRVLVEPEMKTYDDIDTSVLTLEFRSGALGVIQNSRRSVYGHDVRVEVHGSKGKLLSESERATQVWRYGSGGIRGDYNHFFLDRFKDAYLHELQAFVDGVQGARALSPSTNDAIESLRVALAATKSLREGRRVQLSEFVNA
ncbi:MAG: inositol 2-dehydrogenase [Trueperaceae bacterium]